jgi:pilus assembly protein CpaF
LNTGHTGSFSTIHANSAREALVRLARCAHAGNLDLPPEYIIEDIFSAVHYVVHLALTKTTPALRHVAEVLAVTGISPDRRSLLTTQNPHLFTQKELS